MSLYSCCLHAADGNAIANTFFLKLAAVDLVAFVLMSRLSMDAAVFPYGCLLDPRQAANLAHEPSALCTWLCPIEAFGDDEAAALQQDWACIVGGEHGLCLLLAFDHAQGRSDA